jgi:hypothetical protein
MWSGGGQIVSSVQIVVECALSLAAKQCCHLDFMEKDFIWPTAGHFNSVAGRTILSAFLGLSRENRDGWSP